MTAKRVLISIDEQLLSRIDESCQRRGFTRSGYLARLAAVDLEASSDDEPAGGPASDSIRNEISYE